MRSTGTFEVAVRFRLVHIFGRRFMKFLLLAKNIHKPYHEPIVLKCVEIYYFIRCNNVQFLNSILPRCQLYYELLIFDVLNHEVVSYYIVLSGFVRFRKIDFYTTAGTPPNYNNI